MYEAYDHVTLNFNNTMSTAAVFLDIEKAFDIIWHTGLLYILSKLEFAASLIKLISSFLSQRKFGGRRGATRFRPLMYVVQYVHK
jgi:hypothetical protein